MPELMKGHKWRDHSHKMTYPAWVEVKYDEIRCHVICSGSGVDFLSYAGKPLANMQEFSKHFLMLRDATGFTEYDTGFLVNNSFDASYRWVRSTKAGVPPELRGTPVQFMLFDLPELEGASFQERSPILHSVGLEAFNMEIPMVRPEGTWGRDSAHIDELFLRVVERGLEGLMVKSLEHEYVRGARSYGWLKVKPEDDEDGVIFAVHQAISIQGEPLPRAGSVTIKMPDGSTAAPHGIPHALGEDMWKHPEKYIGKWAEFKFMQRDRQGGYRHPTWGRLREAKE